MHLGKENVIQQEREDVSPSTEAPQLFGGALRLRVTLGPSLHSKAIPPCN